MMCDMPTPSSAPASYLPDLPPPSPRHRTAYHNMAPMNFDFNFNQPAPTADQQFQTQLLQRLQSLTGTIANNVSAGGGQYQQRPGSSPYLQQQPQHQLFAPVPHQQQQSSVSPTATINRLSQQSSPYTPNRGSASSSGGDGGFCGNDGIIKPLSDDHHQQQHVTVVVDRTAEEPPPTEQAAPPPVLSPPPPGKQKSLLKVSGGGGPSKTAGKKTATVVGNGPITRSTSEKVPNKSNLMSQVHRTSWARHTTK